MGPSSPITQRAEQSILVRLGKPVGPFGLAHAELSLAVGEHATALQYEAAAKRKVGRLRVVVYQPDLDRLAARLHG